MDVTNEDHVRHALDYVAENLPAGQQGKTIKLLKYTEEVSMWNLVLNYIFYLLWQHKTWEKVWLQEEVG